MRRAAGSAGRVAPIPLALFTLTFLGGAFLTWAWLVEGPAAEVERPPPTAGAAVPEFRPSTSADGMPVAAIDPDALASFLEAIGIPAPGILPQEIEAALAGNLERALHALAETGSASSYGRLGQIFDAMGMHGPCESCYAVAIRLAPDEHRWHHLLGRQLAIRGEVAQAEAELRRAVELRADYLPSRWRLARLAADAGRIDAADELLRETLASARDPYPFTELAGLELLRGRAGEARGLLEEALRREPDSGRAHARMSQALQALGDAAGASAHAREGRYSVKGLDPIPDPLLVEAQVEAGSIAYLRAAARARRHDDPREAVELWERLCRADPVNAEDKIRLAEAYFSAGRAEEAVATLDAAIAQQPRGARFHLARAQMALRMNDAATALAFARRALELEAPPVGAFGVASIALLTLGRVDEAVGPAERALEHSPHDPEVYLFLGSVYSDAGRLEDAARTFRRGLEVDPRSADLRAALAQVERGPPRAR